MCPFNPSCVGAVRQPESVPADIKLVASFKFYLRVQTKFRLEVQRVLRSQQIKQGAVGTTSGPFVSQCLTRAAQILQGTKYAGDMRTLVHMHMRARQQESSKLLPVILLVIYDGESVLM